MADKNKQAKKEKNQAAAVPTPKKPKLTRKACKSPRGVKLVKGIDILAAAVERPIKRHRNDYNQQMAKVKRLANLIQRVG